MAMKNIKMTHDHNRIMNWAKKYKGKPQLIDAPDANADTPGLRIAFPNEYKDTYISERILSNISWRKFFEIFDLLDLELIYMDDFDASKPSQVTQSYKFIKREQVKKEIDNSSDLVGDLFY